MTVPETLPELPDLEADCEACAALCCVALAFDKGEAFAIDKPAGLPCPHLRHHACGIHEDLDRRGFSGCAVYDCEGAGQRALALHGGVSWQEDLEQLAPMQESFAHLRVIHGLIGLLETARRLGLEDDEEDRRRALLAALCPQEMTPDSARALAAGPLPGQVRAFLRSLAHHV